MKIIWIDDDLLQIQIAIERLEDEGIIVDKVSDIKKAQDFIEHNHYDAVIIDVMMTDESGYLEGIRDGLETGKVLARKLRKVYPSLKIIGCSIYENEAIVKWFNDQCAG